MQVCVALTPTVKQEELLMHCFKSGTRNQLVDEEYKLKLGFTYTFKLLMNPHKTALNVAHSIFIYSQSCNTAFKKTIALLAQD